MALLAKKDEVSSLSRLSPKGVTLLVGKMKDGPLIFVPLAFRKVSGQSAHPEIVFPFFSFNRSLTFTTSSSRI